MSTSVLGNDEQWNKQGDWLRLIGELERLQAEAYALQRYDLCLSYMKQWLMKICAKMKEEKIVEKTIVIDGKEKKVHETLILQANETKAFRDIWEKIDSAQKAYLLATKKTADRVEIERKSKAQAQVIELVDEIYVLLEVQNEECNINKARSLDRQKSYVGSNYS